MKKLIVLLILALVFIVQAQSVVECKNLQISKFQISKFGTDSLKYGPVLSVSDFENIVVHLRASTVSNVKFYWMWQRGYSDNSGQVQWKRPMLMGDTVDASTAGNFQAVGNVNNFPGDSDLTKAIDTIGTGGTLVQIKNIVPIWSPYARFVCKGLSGNSATEYNIDVSINQRKYVKTSGSLW